MRKACALPECKKSFEPLHSDHNFHSEKCYREALKRYGAKSSTEPVAKRLHADLAAGTARLEKQ